MTKIFQNAIIFFGRKDPLAIQVFFLIAFLLYVDGIGTIIGVLVIIILVIVILQLT